VLRISIRKTPGPPGAEGTRARMSWGRAAGEFWDMATAPLFAVPVKETADFIALLRIRSRLTHTSTTVNV
jgi:hypothetical protein